MKSPTKEQWEKMSEIEKLRACRKCVKVNRYLSSRMAYWLLSKFKQQ